MSSRADFALAGEAPQAFQVEAALTYIWDVPTLSWVKNTGGGGGGGGAVTIADGADVAQGTTTDVAWVAGAGTVISLLKKIASAGGGAVSIADGSDVAEGATTDAAVITDVAGTVSGKLRGLVKHAYERMPVALGQGTMAQSLRVVLPSDQSAVPISGTVVTGGLTDAQLRASAVPVSGPLTDTQLRATPVPVSGTVTATGPLTDTQLRATPVPVSGTVTSNQGTASANDWRTDLRRGLAVAFAAIDVAASGDNTIVAADVSRKVKVLSYSLVVDSAVSARWKSGVATSLTGAMSIAANGGLADGGGNSPATQWIFETAVNQALVLNLSGAVGARGRISYFLEA